MLKLLYYIHIWVLNFINPTYYSTNQEPLITTLLLLSRLTYGSANFVSLNYYGILVAIIGFSNLILVSLSTYLP